ncbi:MULTISPECIES: cupin domain-containing protein [unclassified Pseudovibrio]|uniref:cupin domain-containing protein n=1 Tax=unclassified Pseudovibrio TaxID=2627060 RepID=UPI0007AE3E60|nr:MULTISPECIES: cupin domain-containing protein [unclassified Pseudovibrio]KZL02987.1 Cupin domain protein [Pseudovibrio sp. W74]KZL04993.1 Cupin domain protein [Pseudovibrio sp. Ad14]
MTLIDHNAQELEEWRGGVVTRMRVSAVNGAHQLCIFDQWCEPGSGAPLHLHAVEELLEVIDGTAEITCGDERYVATGNQSVLIPAGRLHGFCNVGEGTLHVRATLAAPIFEASYENSTEVSRRWVPDGSL